MVCLLGLVDLGAKHSLLGLLLFEQVSRLNWLPAELLTKLLGALGPERSWWTHKEDAPH